MAFAGFVLSMDIPSGLLDSQKFPCPNMALTNIQSSAESDDNTTDSFEVKLICSKCSGLVGIMNNPNQTAPSKKTRKDYYGNDIGKNQKAHKVSFRDVIPQKDLTDVKYIENYKEYNKLYDNPKQVNTTGCLCAIF